VGGDERTFRNTDVWFEATRAGDTMRRRGEVGLYWSPTWRRSPSGMVSRGDHLVCLSALGMASSSVQLQVRFGKADREHARARKLDVPLPEGLLLGETHPASSRSNVQRTSRDSPAGKGRVQVNQPSTTQHVGLPSTKGTSTSPKTPWFSGHLSMPFVCRLLSNRDGVPAATT
jgi:hypothetical protein